MTGPTVIVICAGEATRWGDHRGTAKHLLAPGRDERLLDRTVRLAREHGAARVLVVSKPGDRRYESPGAERVDARLTPTNADADKFLSSRHLWAPGGRTVVLYGDCWFDDDAMRRIIADERREWLLWCRPGPSKVTGATSGECFAVTFWPEHHTEYTAALHRVAALWRAGLLRRCGGWETYRAMTGATDEALRRHRMNGRYEQIGGWTEDFDKPVDYERWLDRRRGRSVSVVVPWRAAPGRERVWDWVRGRWLAKHPSWQIVTGEAPAGPWRKALAVADGAKRATGDILIVADADVVVEDIETAVDAVVGGAPWAMPHRMVHRLTEDSTRALLGGSAGYGPLAQGPYEGHPGGGLVVLPRALLDDVPLDPRFAGWGQEDDAWALALRTLAGPEWRGEEILWHLWHPPQERLSRAVGSLDGAALFERYRAAAGDPSRVRALLAETHPTPTPRGSAVYTYTNRNTGQVVSAVHPNPRLEMLPNWDRIEDGAAPAAGPGPAPEDLAAERERLLARVAEIDALVGPDPAEAPGGPTADPEPAPPEPAPEPARPSVRDTVAAWRAYADRQTPNRDHSSMTKVQLIDAYGTAG